MSCPIFSAEQRLADAASYWKQAHDSYFDPNEFRRAVQSSIQAFRSVTWLLQKAKDSIPDFDSWYSKRQDAMRVDERLRWLVGARNKIEKQGDLETKSKFVAEYIASWLPSGKQEFDLPPTTRPEDIARIIGAAFPESARKEGSVLKLSREWIDSELPDEEILTLLIYAYTQLQELLVRAHDLLNERARYSCDFLTSTTRSTARIPAAMTGFQFPAVCWYSLEHGVLKNYEYKTKSLTKQEIEESFNERYEGFPGIDTKLNQSSSFANICDKFFAMGKQMLQKDGYHAMIAMVFTENGFYPFEFRPADRADKHIMIRELASACRRLRAIWCVLISEAWVAPVSPEHGPYAANNPNKGEALSLDGFHKDEGFQARTAIFKRDGDKIVFSVDQDIQGQPPEILRAVVEAIKQAWG